MRLIIEEITYQSDTAVITGNTAIGTIKGIWKHEKPPVAGKEYHAELTISHLSELNIPHNEKSLPAVYLDDVAVIFKGLLEDMDDEVYFVRFDVDWLEMIDMDEIASMKKIGDFLIFSADFHNIEIYPFTLQ